MNADNIKILNGVFTYVSLTGAEEKSLHWLSGWEPSTIKNIISAFKKAGAPLQSGEDYERE